MPSKQGRLCKSREFDVVLKEGRRAHGQLLITYCLDKPLQEARFGLIVSRRVGGAVVRNTVKRRLRHAFAKKKNALSSKDFVFIARARAADAAQKDIEYDLERCLARVGAE